jgi:flavin reductase (DIM6/NTAB) family NADH-FMN oxidoreductase RutF
MKGVTDPKKQGQFAYLKEIEPVTTYRLFNPRVPVIICSKSGSKVAAMPANSCSSASDSPPIISVAIKKGIRTNEVVRASSHFSVNWLSFEPESSRRIVLDLGKPSNSHKGPGLGDKLKKFGIAYSLVRNIPVLHTACAFALCKVERRISTGDHDLFIASVMSAKASPDFTTDGYWRFRDYKPILYVGSIRSDPLITVEPY